MPKKFASDDERREYNRLNAAKNPEKARAAGRRFYAKNPQKGRESSAKWREANPEKREEYYRANYDRVANTAKCAGARGAKKQATPKWANSDAIRAIYAEADRLTRETGIEYHVDHIVPLKSDIVCGLHWEGNLQPIPAFDNLSKLNRWWPDMPATKAA